MIRVTYLIVPITIRTVAHPSTIVRKHLRDALYADFVGPMGGAKVHATSREVLATAPSRTYLTGFLVPEEDREVLPEEDDSAGLGTEANEVDGEEEKSPKKKKFYAGSMGMSLLVPNEASSLSVDVSFARYLAVPHPEHPKRRAWERVPHQADRLEFQLESISNKPISLPGVSHLKLTAKLREIPNPDKLHLPVGVRVVSLFLVNTTPVDEHKRDESRVFQIQMSVSCDAPIVRRPNTKGLGDEDDADARAWELQYRNHGEYAVGHSVAVEAIKEAGEVHKIRSRWIPEVEVPIVAPHQESDVEVSMDALGKLQSSSAVEKALGALPKCYANWIDSMASADVGSGEGRKETQSSLVRKAKTACDRISRGIELLREDEVARRIFARTNEAMALAARKRSPAFYQGKSPSWRLFQLAFLLSNIEGIVDPTSKYREDVELIFFPTGGGKTEAYLGVIAFTLLMRRFRGQSEPHRGRGVAVILRYTLRLLTLDQLERATILICALDQIRLQDPSSFGKERFEVGLWVGAATTSNSFKSWTRARKESQSKDSASCPLEKCPWCKTPLGAGNLELRPTAKSPDRLVIRCSDPSQKCPYSDRSPDALGIPLAFIDEQVYRELPCFVIGTVDKFAMIPWRAASASLFGRVASESGGLFYGTHEKPKGNIKKLPQGLLPPELIVQDELHLISGPLGTMVGLYEAVIEELCVEEIDGKKIRPKIIVSTATANHASEQVKLLFGRNRTNVFPPTGIEPLETYFSVVKEVKDNPGRLYLGVAGSGQPFPRLLIATYISLLTAAEKASKDESIDKSLRDAYLSLVGYFNSLRELGGMRRAVDDDVKSRCAKRSLHASLDGLSRSEWFADRELGEPGELTSRESTDDINSMKNLASQPKLLADGNKDASVPDVVLASNMISVGVDISRLSLMAVAGQPKTTAEYIQASSRVGRNRDWPGLVVTCYNLFRARDRSHYESFFDYHETFYRYVEAQTLTPKSPRALDRGLSGALLTAARVGVEELRAPKAADDISKHRESLKPFVNLLGERFGSLAKTLLERRLDAWEKIVKDSESGLSYSGLDGKGKNKGQLLMKSALDPVEEQSEESLFQAPTSMRDVEQETHIWFWPKGKKPEA